MTIQLLNFGTPNKNKVCVGDVAFFFSYSTIIAFHSPATGLVCSENVWSNTTGKFLNEIEPNKSKRVSSDEFEKKLRIAIYTGITTKNLEVLALSDNREIKGHATGLLKALEKSSFEIKK